MAWRLFVTVAHIHSVESRENLLLTTPFVEDVFERFGAVGCVFGGTSARFLGDHFDHRGKAQDGVLCYSSSRLAFVRSWKHFEPSFSTLMGGTRWSITSHDMTDLRLQFTAYTSMSCCLVEVYVVRPQKTPCNI